MNVLGNSTVQRAREVEVDDVHDVLDIQTASRNTRGNENRASSGTEGTPVADVRKSSLMAVYSLTKHLHAHAEYGRSESRCWASPC